MPMINGCWALGKRQTAEASKKGVLEVIMLPFTLSVNNTVANIPWIFRHSQTNIIAIITAAVAAARILFVYEMIYNCGTQNDTLINLHL